MSEKGKINIFIEIADQLLKKQLSQVISDDWAYHWHIINKEINQLSPTDTDIAVIDNPANQKFLDKKTVKILLSRQKSSSNGFFVTLSTTDPIDIFTEIKRAYSHRQIIIQNREALVPQLENSINLATIAQSLSAKVTQLIRQSEMRIALVDQMPVGVIGVDDEGIIVLANPKAIEILGVEDLPIWGMPAENLLTFKINSFISSPDTITTINRNNENIVVRKSDFELQGSFAGTIIILTKDFPDQEDTNIG